MKTKILLTYDYELFLGNRSGSVKDCIIDPTNKILELHRKSKTNAIFFIDCTYLIALNRLQHINKCRVNYALISEQINEIISLNHKIYPHIHPHWHDAIYLEKEDQWDLSNIRYYKFESLPGELKEYYFKNSIEIINGFVKNKYPINSYRAGGWSIQPFAQFKSYFQKYGIKNDLSVIPGKLIKSNAHSFDFKMEKTTAMYQFNEEVNIPEIHGEFNEYPISSIEFRKIEKWIDFKLSAIQNKLKTRNNYKTINVEIFKEFDYFTTNKRIASSFEALNVLRVIKIIYSLNTSNYYHFISHPKLINSIDLFWMKILLFFMSKIDIETKYE
jgi:hypothetical protein